MVVEPLMKYTFTLRHDAGTHIIVTHARDLAFATQRILRQENAPERAITQINIEDS